jgi:hypothetical protein
MPRWILVILAGAAAVGSVLMLSRNFACAAVPACVLIMSVVGLLDRTLFGVIAGKDAARDAARLLVALGAAVAIGLIPPFRLTPASAFKSVFGMSPPPGVTKLTAESRYAGGPGDHVILLSFYTDQSAADQLIAKLSVDGRLARVWNDDAGRDWARFLADRNVKLLDYIARGPWISQTPTMVDPQFYRHHEPADIRDWLLIRDADSGFTIVRFVQG